MFSEREGVVRGPNRGRGEGGPDLGAGTEDAGLNFFFNSRSIRKFLIMFFVNEF